MDLISKGSQQVADFLRSCPPAARLGFLFGMAILLVSAAYLFRASSTPQEIDLFGARVLSDREIAGLETAFAKAGLNDWVVTPDKRLRVPRQHRFTYLSAAHAENSLPASFDTILEEMLKTSTPFEPKELRDMKRNFAIQRELAGIIDALDGIERATVKVNEERTGPFSRETKRTALVAARATSGEFLNAVQVDAIRRTIASGTGTSPENIVVTDLRGVAHAGNVATGGPTPYEHLFSAEKKKYEQYYQEKILRSLSMIPGVVVGVNVELAKSRPYSSLVPDFGDSVPLAASASPARTQLAGHIPAEETRDALGNRAEEVAVSVDAPGSSDHGFRVQSMAVSEGGPNGEPRTRLYNPGLMETGSSGGVSRRSGSSELTNRELGAFGFQEADASVTATVQIPRSYFQRIRQKQGNFEDDEMLAADSEELRQLEREETERIEKTVKNLLPSVADSDAPRAQVVVQSFTDGLETNSASGSFIRRIADWFVEHRAAWISLACGILSLLVVPSILVAIRSTLWPQEYSPSFDSTGNHEGEARLNPDGRDMENGTGWTDELALEDSDLKKKLLRLVREDPEVAAAVLSQWIEDAA